MQKDDNVGYLVQVHASYLVRDVLAVGSKHKQEGLSTGFDVVEHVGDKAGGAIDQDEEPWTQCRMPAQPAARRWPMSDNGFCEPYHNIVPICLQTSVSFVS